VFIKKILEQDEGSGEAEIIVSDGEHDVLCNAWKFVSNRNNFSLNAFSVKEVERSYVHECYAVRNDYSYFAYDICGKLTDNGIVAVGSVLINIDLNDIPKDIQKNEYIKFSCLRIDLAQD